ncbi:MAG: bis(5'-nucleosyl)-tetraphosphatase (symmetrical) YqeK [Spirochaetes bacterium]|nr:bis(5'-nucleosyl)-tetraphosphatase (symmetrical) YqeK [Spirochaetota bacterium]
MAVRKHVKRRRTDETFIVGWLKDNLAKDRYEHSLRVRDMAVRLAERYRVSVHKTTLASLLHDTGRSLPDAAAMNTFLKQNGITFPREHVSKSLLHSMAGVVIARTTFDVQDETILDAIRWHTTGRANLSMLGKILYMADHIEPGRHMPICKDLRKTAMHDFNATLRATVRLSLEYVIATNRFLAKETVDFYNELV